MCRRATRSWPKLLPVLDSFSLGSQKNTLLTFRLIGFNFTQISCSITLHQAVGWEGMQRYKHAWLCVTSRPVLYVVLWLFMHVLDWVGRIQLLHTCLREVTIISQECCFCPCPSHGMFINRNGPEECGQRTKCDSAASFLWTLPCVSLLAGRAESWVCICEWTTFLFVPTGIFMCLTTSSVSNILQYSMQVCRDPQVSLISCTLSQSGHYLDVSI